MYDAIFWTWIFLGFLVFIKIFIGFLLLLKPLNRNGFIGFRTTKTLESDIAWNFANHECGKLYLFFGGLEGITSLFVLYLTYDGFKTLSELYIPLAYITLTVLTMIITTMIVKSKVDKLTV